jgi:acetyltransferase EpsM
MESAGAASEGTDPHRSMTARPLVVLGGGEHGRVLIEAARSQPGTWDVLGVVDPSPSAGAVTSLGTAYLGDDEDFATGFGQAGDEPPFLAIGVGGIDPGPRRRLAERFGTAAWATIVHATAWISPTAELGPGATVLAGSTVNAGATIGGHAIVNSGAVVEHDVSVGPFAHIAPGAVIGGGAVIGDGAFIGLGARVRDHVTIGEDAIVAMGAVVVGDVAPCTTVSGVPARAVETADA